jgi:hypothetical protein
MSIGAIMTDYSDSERDLIEALSKRACGYKQSTRRVVNRAVLHGEYVPEREEITETDIPPDANSAKFLLMNLFPERWKETSEVTHDLSKLSDADLIERVTGIIAGSGTPQADDTD